MLDKLPPRFINWRPLERDGKVTKQPFDFAFERPIDANDPANWRSLAVASAAGPIGFTISDQDNLVFLDFDNARGPDGQWKAEAVAMIQPFIAAGAAVEISQSQNGLHIIGRVADKSAFADRRNRWQGPNGIGCEFYATGRFCAFGPHGWQGDFSADITAAVDQFVPRRENQLPGLPQSHAIVLPHTAVEGALGPSMSDEAVLAKLRTIKFAAEEFGDGPSFDQLAEGDPKVLAPWFPPKSTGQDFGYSEVDYAILRRIAFVTGKDSERMIAIHAKTNLALKTRFQTDAKYQATTLRSVIAKTSTIYDGKSRRREQQIETAKIGETSTGGTLFPHETEAWFSGCTYVSSANRVFDAASGQLMKPEVFRAMKGGKRFYVDWEPPQNIVTDAFKALTENRIFSFPRVLETCFRPDLECGAIVGDAVNTFKRPQPKRIKGDPSKFLQHIAKMYPDERDQRIIVTWLAMAVQRHGKKIRWSIVIQSVEGAGKESFAKVLRHAVSDRYFQNTNARDVSNKFNAQFENKLIVLVDEVMIEKRREILEVLKPWITNSRLEVQAKGLEKRMIDSACNLLFFTNYKSGVPIKADGRRYSVFYSALQHERDLIEAGMNDAYFNDLFSWLDGDGAAIIYDFLMDYPVTGSEFDVRRAPKTSSTDEALVESDGDLEAMIRESVDADHRGFRAGWISSWAVIQKAKAEGIRISPRTIGQAIEQMSYRKLGQVTNYIFEEGNTRPTIYCKNQTIGDWQEDYKRAQGYDHKKMSVPDFLHVIKG